MPRPSRGADGELRARTVPLAQLCCVQSHRLAELGRYKQPPRQNVFFAQSTSAGTHARRTARRLAAVRSARCTVRRDGPGRPFERDRPSPLDELGRRYKRNHRKTLLQARARFSVLSRSPPRRLRNDARIKNTLGGSDRRDAGARRPRCPPLRCAGAGALVTLGLARVRAAGRRQRTESSALAPRRCTRPDGAGLPRGARRRRRAADRPARLCAAAAGWRRVPKSAESGAGTESPPNVGGRRRRRWPGTRRQRRAEGSTVRTLEE